MLAAEVVAGFHALANDNEMNGLSIAISTFLHSMHFAYLLLTYYFLSSIFNVSDKRQESIALNRVSVLIKRQN